MKEKQFFWTSTALGALFTGIIGAYSGSNLAAGVTLLVSYLLYRKGISVGRLRGRTNKSKAFNSFAGNLIEFSGISTAIFFTASWPVVLASAAVGLNESFFQNIRQNSVDLKPKLIGRLERVTLIGLTLTASHFNEYVLIYGLLAVGALALFESARQLFFLLKK